MVKKVLFILVFFIIGMAGSIGQSFYFTHYQVDNGLSNNAVLCAMQDKLGFMWFGTRDGLNRFDGISYKIFRNDPSDPYSLGSNAIMCLAESAEKKIWIGTEKGLFIFDEFTERFTPFKIAGNGAIQALKIDGDNVYFITLYVLHSYNIKSKKLKTHNFPQEVTSFSIFHDGNIWVTTTAGLVARYNTSGNSFDKSFNIFSQSQNPVSQRIQTLCEAGNGNILVGTSNDGLKLLNTGNGNLKNIITYNTDRTDINVMDILKTSDSTYWIATQSGIYIMNLKTNRYNYLSKQYDDPYSLSDNIIQSLFKDQHGGIWVSTYFGGVNYFSSRQMIFKKFFPQKTVSSISGYAVGEIKKDNQGRLWIATEDAGLNQFNPVTGKFINYAPELEKGSVTYSNIQCLLVSNDSVWAGTFLHGLDLLNLQGKRIKNYNTLNSSIGSNFSDALLKTSSGTIIVGTDKGAYSFSKEQNNFVRINVLPQTFFRALSEDANGSIWAGTYGNGVYKYNPGTNKAEHYVFAVKNNKSISSNIINYIYCASNKMIWLATEGGLVKLDPVTGKMHLFTTKQNLPANVIYTIIEDDRKNLWISTSKGLVRFNPDNNNVRVFSKSEGLLTDQFNYRSVCKDNNGNIYFGSVKGMVSFHPDSIQESSLQAPVYITGFQVYNKELLIGKESPLQQSILLTSRITLPYNQSTISIDFAALDYSAPLTMRYAYKLEGLDNKWNNLPGNRKAYFTELPPGNYTFIIKKLDIQDPSSSNAARLQIVILPPIWLTWEAYLIYIITGLLLTYFIIMFFVNRSRERHKRKLEKMAFEKEKSHYEDKIDFFTNVAHEIKTPLTLIKGPLENIIDEADQSPSVKKNLELMSRNTDRLMLLTNQILDFRKIELNGFHLNFVEINISELLDNIYQRFKPIGDSHDLNLIFTNHDEVNASADEEALIKIFSNLIDNAIKYAARQVTITLKYTNNNTHYQLIVTNDGFVIPKEEREKIFDSFYRVKETARQSGTGIGLTLSRTLAIMHSGSLTLDAESNDLNIFVLELPVNPNNEI